MGGQQPWPFEDRLAASAGDAHRHGLQDHAFVEGVEKTSDGSVKMMHGGVVAIGQPAVLLLAPTSALLRSLINERHGIGRGETLGQVGGEAPQVSEVSAVGGEQVGQVDPGEPRLGRRLVHELEGGGEGVVRAAALGHSDDLLKALLQAHVRYGRVAQHGQAVVAVGAQLVRQGDPLFGETLAAGQYLVELGVPRGMQGRQRGTRIIA